MNDRGLIEVLTILKIILAPLISSHDSRAQLMDRLDQCIEQSAGGKAPFGEAFASQLREQVLVEDRAAGR